MPMNDGVARLSMPMNDEGRPKGIAFISFSDKESVKKALKFNGEEYAGRTLVVRKAGDRGEKGDKGKGKGKDGGKDGKGKGKKGKGKGKGLSDEKKAAKDGAMVESTGTKQTFADSDDEEDTPAPKKVPAAKPPADDDDDSDDEPPPKKAAPKKAPAKKVEEDSSEDDD